MGTITTTKLEHTPTPQPQPKPEPEPEIINLEDTTLAELRDKAAALDLPTYGTKAQLAERIASA